ALGTLVADGWAPLQLPLAPPANLSNRPAQFQQGFKDGFYANGNAAAFVAQAGDALVLSFRGTNDNQEGLLTYDNQLTPDEVSWTNMSAYYASIQPLITAIDNYVDIATHGIKKVYVVGHSLGAAMIDQFMAIHQPNGPAGNVSYEAVEFAHPDFNNAGIDFQTELLNA
ncbi:MAG: hypothetical protein WCL29_09310, partial [Pseudomonadota bacterium]